MKLKVPDRVVLLGVMPTEGNITTLLIVRDLRDALTFSEEEHAALDIQIDTENENIKWDEDADTGKEVEFGSVAFQLVRDTLDKLSEAGSLQMQHLDLYERFAGPQHADDSEAK